MAVDDEMGGTCEGETASLDGMIEDYVRRAPGRYTAEEIREVIRNNHVLIGEGCFLVFAVVHRAIHILFPYAAKGRRIEPLGRELERVARAMGFERIKIITGREKAFGRKFPDYRPVGVVFEKELR